MEFDFDAFRLYKLQGLHGMSDGLEQAVSVEKRQAISTNESVHKCAQTHLTESKSLTSDALMFLAKFQLR